MTSPRRSDQPVMHSGGSEGVTGMAGKKAHTPEEIVAKLRQAEVMIGQGKTVADAVRAIGVTEPTWRNSGRAHSPAEARMVGQPAERSARRAAMSASMSPWRRRPFVFAARRVTSSAVVDDSPKQGKAAVLVHQPDVVDAGRQGPRPRCQRPGRQRGARGAAPCKSQRATISATQPDRGATPSQTLVRHPLTGVLLG